MKIKYDIDVSKFPKHDFKITYNNYNENDGDISVINDYIIVDNNEKYTLLVEEFDIINPKVYYLEIDKKTISNDNDYLKKLKDGMTEIMTPTIIEMGYIHLLDNNINYPIIENDLNEIYIIKDKDNINKVK